MTLTRIRNSIVLVGVTLLAVMVADAAGFDPFDSDTDIQHDDRRVEIKFHAIPTDPRQPVRFDVEGGFHASVEFEESDKRDGYRKGGVTQTGQTVWGRMFLHVYSGIPQRMWCDVWQGKKNITKVAREDLDNSALVYCSGVAK